MTREEVIQRLEDMKYSVTIAKRAVEKIETFEMIANDIESDEEAINIAIETLKNQKTGHWIDDEFGSKCSCCDVHTYLDKFGRPMKFRHCSMCGAKMVEPQKSEV